MSDTNKNRSIVCCFCGAFWTYVEGVDDRDALIKKATEHESICDRNPYTAKIAQLERELSHALKLAEDNGKLAHQTACELADTRKQRDDLANALQGLMYGHEVKGEWEMCEQALAAAKGGKA
jgi:hypothetical protein